MQKLSHCTKCVVIILLDLTKYNISISLFFSCNEHEGGLWSRKKKIETIYKKLYHSFCNAQTYNGYIVGRELEWMWFKS